MTIDSLFGNEKGIYQHHPNKMYDERRDLRYHHADEKIQFNKNTYDYSNALKPVHTQCNITGDPNNPAYCMTHPSQMMTKADVEALRTIVAGRSISEMTHKPRF